MAAAPALSSKRADSVMLRADGGSQTRYLHERGDVLLFVGPPSAGGERVNISTVRRAVLSSRPGGHVPRAPKPQTALKLSVRYFSISRIKRNKLRGFRWLDNTTD